MRKKIMRIRIRCLISSLDSSNVLDQQNKGLFTPLPIVGTRGEGLDSHIIPSSPVYCPYYESICPNNIHKYAMKCLTPFNNNCSIKIFIDKYPDYKQMFVGSKI